MSFGFESASPGGDFALESRLAQLGQQLCEWLVERRRVFVVIVHLAIIVLSSYAAFWLRFDGAIPPEELARFGKTIIPRLMLSALLFIPFRLYSGLWKYTGISELCNIVMAAAASTTLFYLFVHWGLRMTEYSRAVFVIDGIVLVTLLSAVRLSKRIARLAGRTKGSKRVVIFGGGDAGEMIVREMRNRAGRYEPVAFIDDNPAKRGRRIHGVPVLGSRHDLGRILAATDPHEVLVAMPGADPSTVRGVVEILQPFKVPITTLPSVRDILDGRVAVNQIRDLTVEDLLSRAPIDLSIEPVRNLISGTRVLVTGAGGSIGSELSRQIAALHPASLVLYERYENSLQKVTSDLVDRFGSTGIHPMIGDVTDSKRVNQVLEHHRPQLIFHAAAHKHVPLMEHNPCEAVKNNVVGTATIAKAAERWGVERFIMISTDKAVNPSSVMGATKRIGELILQGQSGRGATRFAVVRFGNVLGSNGSVIPRFREQIKAGGPVTVTHPEIRRFFMLIPEAVQLVLHAAALGEPGMVYVLEMGEQIKLVDMARNLIRCSGFIPDEEIPITFVGLRPGEKLFEELVGDGETAEPSPVPTILRVRGGAPGDSLALEAQINDLVAAAVRGESHRVIQQLRTMLPTFAPPGDQPAAVPAWSNTGPADVMFVEGRQIRRTAAAKRFVPASPILPATTRPEPGVRPES